jgi:Holliday junction resolvasome RuvABC DNA-binding subunit
VSSRTARAIQRNLVSKTKQNKQTSKKQNNNKKNPNKQKKEVSHRRLKSLGVQEKELLPRESP